MSEQTIADFVTIITTDAAATSAIVYDFHEDLATQLFALGRVDAAERTTALSAVSAASLIGLRQRCELLLTTIQTALASSGI